MLTSPPSKPPQRRLNADEKRRLKADLATNVSTDELAKTYGITRRSVQRFAARLSRDPEARIESRVLGVRLEPDEFRALDAQAGRLGMTRTEFARKALRRATGFFDPDDDLIELGSDLSREVRRIGNNLNQLAYHANRKALVSGRAEITPEDMAAIVAMRDELKLVSDLISKLIVTKAKRRKARVDHILKALD